MIRKSFVLARVFKRNYAATSKTSSATTKKSFKVLEQPKMDTSKAKFKKKPQTKSVDKQ